jgi:acyl-CoA synthetase (AMP-forming)/AMP-acid ligase II
MYDDELDPGGLQPALANYKLPKVFEVIDSMPLLPNGKLDKTALKRRARRTVG